MSHPQRAALALLAMAHDPDVDPRHVPDRLRQLGHDLDGREVIRRANFIREFLILDPLSPINARRPEGDPTPGQIERLCRRFRARPNHRPRDTDGAVTAREPRVYRTPRMGA